MLATEVDSDNLCWLCPKPRKPLLKLPQKMQAVILIQLHLQKKITQQKLLPFPLEMPVIDRL